MEALSGIELRDRAALIGDTLVLADLHLGRAETAVELPVGAGEDMRDRLAALLDQFDPSTVVIAGDLLHSFEGVPRGVTRTLGALRGTVRAADAELVVLPGNHDTLLDAVWDGPTAPTHRVGETVICHGHTAPEPETEADRYVIGHDHPTIVIEGDRRPCYLAGDGVYRGADVLVVPTFNRVVAGVPVNDVTGAAFMSPLLPAAGRLSPVVRDETVEETLVFPPLEEFRHHL